MIEDLTYHSEDDKKRIEKAMQKTGCDNFELHQGMSISPATYLNTYPTSH